MTTRRLPFCALAAGLLGSAALAGNETGRFFVVRMTGYFGETTNAVMTDVQCKRAFAEATDANNVAVAAYSEFAETWHAEQKKSIEAQKTAAGGKKVEVDRSMMNIVLEKPERKKVQPGEPFVTRKEAEAELAAREGRDSASLGQKQDGEAPAASKPPNAAAGGNDVRSFLRSQQLAMFLAIAEKRRKALHDQRGALQGGGNGTRMGANTKKPLTDRPPPLERPSEIPAGGDAPPAGKPLTNAPAAK